MCLMCTGRRKCTVCCAATSEMEDLDSALGSVTVCVCNRTVRWRAWGGSWCESRVTVNTKCMTIDRYPTFLPYPLSLYTLPRPATSEPPTESDRRTNQQAYLGSRNLQSNQAGFSFRFRRRLQRMILDRRRGQPFLLLAVTREEHVEGIIFQRGPGRRHRRHRRTRHLLNHLCGRFLGLRLSAARLGLIELMNLRASAH